MRTSSAIQSRSSLKASGSSSRPKPASAAASGSRLAAEASGAQPGRPVDLVEAAQLPVDDEQVRVIEPTGPMDRIQRSCAASDCGAASIGSRSLAMSDALARRGLARFVRAQVGAGERRHEPALSGGRQNVVIDELAVGGGGRVRGADGGQRQLLEAASRAPIAAVPTSSRASHAADIDLLAIDRQ